MSVILQSLLIISSFLTFLSSRIHYWSFQSLYPSLHRAFLLYLTGASLRETEDDGRKPIRVKFPSEQQKGSRNGVNYVTSSDCSKIDDLTRDLLAADKEDFELADLTSVADFFGEVKVSSPVATRLKGPLIKSELVVKEPKKFTSYWKSYANHTNVINGDGSPAPGPEVSFLSHEGLWEFHILFVFQISSSIRRSRPLSHSLSSLLLSGSHRWSRFQDQLKEGHHLLRYKNIWRKRRVV